MPSLKRVAPAAPAATPPAQDEERSPNGMTPVGGEDRRRQLQQFSPRSLPLSVAEKIRGHVIEFVMSTPEEGTDKDRKRMSAAMMAAAADFHRSGLPINWDAALSPTAYEQFKVSRPDLPESTHGTYKARWAELRQDTGLESKVETTNGRKPASRGYTHKEAQTFFAAAQTLTGRNEQNYLVGCVLTFWAGADATEMHNLTWDMIRPYQGTLLVRLCNRRGEVRDVPLAHAMAAHLRRFMGQPAESVFDDGRGSPANTSKRFEPFFRTHPQLKVDWSRARNTFIIRLLEAKVPFHTVAHLADLNPGGHTAQDLLSYCQPLPEAKHIDNMLEGLR